MKSAPIKEVAMMRAKLITTCTAAIDTSSRLCLPSCQCDKLSIISGEKWMQFQAGCNGKIYSEEQLLAKETLPWLLILLFFFYVEFQWMEG